MHRWAPAPGFKDLPEMPRLSPSDVGGGGARVGSGGMEGSAEKRLDSSDAIDLC